MTTAACSLTGSAYYNGGWLPGGSSYNGVGAVTSFAGGNNSDLIRNCMYVERFTIPDLWGAFNNCSFTFTFDGVKNDSSSSSTVKWGISSVGNNGQGLGAALPAMIATGTWTFDGLTAKHQQFTKTTSAINFGSGNYLAGTYYLWIWGGNVIQMYAHGSYYSASINYTAVTACGAPTAISISASIAVPNGNVTLSWSGASDGVSNAIVGYHIYVSDNGGGYYHAYTVNTAATSGSTTVSALSTRGQIRYFKVFTIGAAGYNSSESPLTWVKANSLPNVPSVSVSRSTVPSAGGSVTFTVTAGSDSDGQTAYVYYATTTGGAKTLVSGSVTLTITSSNSSIYFWTYDGLEYSSSYTTKATTINVVPVITAMTINRTQLAGVSKTNYPLCKKLSATCTIDKTVTTYTWYFAMAATTGAISSTGTVFGSNSSSLSNYDLSNNITKGYFYRIGLKVNDGYDDSATYWETYGGQMPFNTKAAVITSLFNQPGPASQNVAGTNATNFNTGLTLKWTNPTITSGYCNISLTQIITRISTNGGANYGQPEAFGDYNKSSGATGIVGNITLSTLARGTYVQIGTRITDTGGGTSDVWSATTMMRAQLPTLISGTLSCSLETIKPYTNTSNFSLVGVTGLGVNGLIYSYAASFEDKTTVVVNIPYSAGNLTTTDTTTTLVLPAATINGILKASALRDSTSPDIWNYNYAKVRYRMTVSDNFGNVGDTLYSPSAVASDYYNVNFIESPVFAAGRMNTIIQYYTSGPTKAVTTTSANNGRMVQAGELLQFHFTLPTDYNQDIVGYELSVAKINTKPSRLGVSYETYSYELLQYFDTSAKIATGDPNIFYLERAVAAYSINKFLTFRLRAVDSKGNYSNDLYSQTYVVACRCVAPTFSVQNLNVASDTNLMSFSLNVTSLGGSIFEGSTPAVYGYFGMANYGSDASDQDSNYPNFERTITGYTAKADVKIEICKDGNFSNTVATNYLTTTLTHVGAYSTLYGASKSYPLDGTIFEGQKIYVKVSLILRTRLTAAATFETVTTVASTVTFYAAAPTLAHRPNHLGINTNNFSELDDDVLVITDFSGRRYIRFVGTDESSNQFEIKIDLKTGSIDGSKISGGTW